MLFIRCEFMNNYKFDASNSNGLISWKRLKWTYFAKAFGKELFRKRVRKGLISGKLLQRPYSKTKFSKKFVL